jgi:hypothetical protein
MTTEKATFLTCEACRHPFRYRLIHSGFNNSSYAYCSMCGMTAILSAYGPVPAAIPIRWYEAISTTVETHLRPCACGGRFTRDSAPRCPNCHVQLSPDGVTTTIEANAPGTGNGRWQRSWTGLYCLIVEERAVEDNWVGAS